MKVLTNNGWYNGKLFLETVEMKRGEVVLIELMFVSIGEEFNVRMLRNPNWRYEYTWSLEQKAVWFAQAVKLMKENKQVRRDVLKINTSYMADITSALYLFGNKYGFRQSRELRHVSRQALLRRGNNLLAAARAQPEEKSIGRRVLGFIERLFGGTL